SECGTLSDSLPKNLIAPVRMQGSFGQLAQEFDCSCPNAGLFRTACPGIPLLLSECRALSDSLPKNLIAPVRMQGSFGPLAQEFHCSCPNAGLFRTACPGIPPLPFEMRALFGHLRAE